MIKKMMIGLLVLIVILNLAGCGNENANSDKDYSVAEKQDTVIVEDKKSSDNEASSDDKVLVFEKKSTDDTSSKDNKSLTNNKTGASDVDVDLTQLSDTMVYSEVYNMLVSPDDYIGKTVKMNGAFSIYQDETTGKIYYTCIIADAAACCSQGLEFVWKGEHKYPEDYPELGSEITVTGEFQTYEEDGSLYCNLVDAELYMIRR